MFIKRSGIKYGRNGNAFSIQPQGFLIVFNEFFLADDGVGIIVYGVVRLAGGFCIGQRVVDVLFKLSIVIGKLNLYDGILIQKRQVLLIHL